MNALLIIGWATLATWTIPNTIKDEELANNLRNSAIKLEFTRDKLLRDIINIIISTELIIPYFSKIILF